MIDFIIQKLPYNLTSNAELAFVVNISNSSGLIGASIPGFGGVPTVVEG